MNAKVVFIVEINAWFVMFFTVLCKITLFLMHPVELYLPYKIINRFQIYNKF